MSKKCEQTFDIIMRRYYYNGVNRKRDKNMTEFYKMTAEEREQINSKIYSMIGTQHDAMSEYKDRSERMMAFKT